METPSLHKSFKVVESVPFLKFISVLAESPSFSSLLRCRCHMLEPREKTSRLSSDDGHRDSSSQVVKKQTLFRRRHRPALQQGNVLGFGDCQLLDQVVESNSALMTRTELSIPQAYFNRLGFQMICPIIFKEYPLIFPTLFIN